jgi:hypothetical protein
MPKPLRQAGDRVRIGGVLLCGALVAIGTGGVFAWRALRYMIMPSFSERNPKVWYFTFVWMVFGIAAVLAPLIAIGALYCGVAWILGNDGH